MALRTPDECMIGHGTKTCCRAIGKLPESLLWHDRDVPRFSSLSAVWCPLGDEGLLTVFCQRLSPMKERAISNIPDSCDLADTLPTCLRSAHPFPSESGRKRSRRAWHTPFRFAEVPNFGGSTKAGSISLCCCSRRSCPARRSRPAS